MAGKGRKQPQGAESTYQRAGDERSWRVQNLLYRAPQFEAVANVAEGEAPEPAASQREFLDNFSRRLAEGSATGQDPSGSVATPKPARRSRAEDEKR